MQTIDTIAKKLHPLGSLCQTLYYVGFCLACAKTIVDMLMSF
jgi:hypothetical protein